MTHRWIERHVRTDREGQTLAMVAVMLVVLLALLSLGIDLGMAYTARVHAQRAADAAALAGASVFMEHPLRADYEAEIQRRAREYAGRNYVHTRLVSSGYDPGDGSLSVDDNEVAVQILFDEYKVRVWVTREGIRTWFARFIGTDEVTVRAMAAAAVINAGVTECVKPWVIVDTYLRNDGGVPSEGEKYDQDLHWYKRSGSQCDGAATGFGSNTQRNPYCDFGHQLTIKSNDPQDEAVPEPGIFMPIRLAPSEGQEECTKGGGGGGAAGAASYRRNICGCNATPLGIGDTVWTQTGNMVGPTIQGIEELLGKDPTARFVESMDPAPGYVYSELGDGSPRLVTVALISPDEIVKSGHQALTIANFGRYFLEEVWEENEKGVREAKIRGRFLYWVNGTAEGETASPLTKMLRLVE
jgi:hypothetical protein